MILRRIDNIPVVKYASKFFCKSHFPPREFNRAKRLFLLVIKQRVCRGDKSQYRFEKRLNHGE